MSNCEEVKKRIAERGVKEILHFTKGSAGLTGILAVKAVQSRQRLEQDQRLEYIFEPTASFRKDKAWLDYVNLSISEINSSFFSVASERWHKSEGEWWVILAFDPVITAHGGVFFTTTNNIYSDVARDINAKGFEALFARSVKRWGSNNVSRGANLADNLTTCEQAEILYPREVPTEFLRRIYVRDGEDKDDTMAQLDVLGHKNVEVVIAPDRFKGR